LLNVNQGMCHLPYWKWFMSSFNGAKEAIAHAPCLAFFLIVLQIKLDSTIINCCIFYILLLALRGKKHSKKTREFKKQIRYGVSLKVLLCNGQFSFLCLFHEVKALHKCKRTFCSSNYLHLLNICHSIRIETLIYW
jgi:hypothetical protein